VTPRRAKVNIVRKNKKKASEKKNTNTPFNGVEWLRKWCHESTVSDTRQIKDKIYHTGACNGQGGRTWRRSKEAKNKPVKGEKIIRLPEAQCLDQRQGHHLEKSSSYLGKRENQRRTEKGGRRGTGNHRRIKETGCGKDI